MLLLIDCGNTNIVFAIAQNDRILKKWRINTDPKRTADEYYVWLIKLLEIENINFLSISNCIIASVVPEALFSLLNFYKEYADIYIREILKINGVNINDSSSYIVKHDYYLFIGDNRDNSLDSRFWGFVPDYQILGTPLLSLLNISKFKIRFKTIN